jgi:hypothetical protein
MKGVEFMNIADKLMGQQFQELLQDLYQKGVEAEKMDTVEFIDEIVQQITLRLNQSNFINIEKVK